MTDQVIDVVQQRLCLSKVAVPKQVDVKVGYGHGIDARRDGVGSVVAGPRRVVQFRGEVDRPVCARGVQRRPLGVLGIESRKVQEQVSVNVRRGEKELAEPYLLRIGGNALQCAE